MPRVSPDTVNPTCDVTAHEHAASESTAHVATIPAVQKILAWKWTAAIALCFAIRLGVIAASPDSFREDPDAYRSLATTWAETGVYGRIGPDGEAVPTAYRPPLYPWMLSWLVSPNHARGEWLGIACTHALLGTLTCWLTYAIGRRLSLTPAISAIAACLVLIDPILLRQSTLVMTETLATFLGVLAWWLAIAPQPWMERWRRYTPRGGEWPLLEAQPRVEARSRGWMIHPFVRSFLLGAALGLACLCRPTALAWLVLWVLFRSLGRLFFGERQASWRWQTILNGTMLVVAFAAILGDWAIRNQTMLGRAVVTTTHGGYTLYLANNPVLYEHLHASGSREWNEEGFHALWRSERMEVEGSGELASDRLANQLAIETIRSDPWGFVRGCAVRLGWFWAMWPSERQASPRLRWGIFLWYSAVYLGAVVGSVSGLLAWRQGLQDHEAAQSKWTGVRKLRRGWIGWAPGVTLVISLMMVHSVYWSNMRMRSPAVPVVSLVAAYGIARICRRPSGAEPAKAESSQANTGRAS